MPDRDFPSSTDHRCRRTGGTSIRCSAAGSPPGPGHGSLSLPNVRVSSRKALAKSNGSGTSPRSQGPASAEAQRLALRSTRDIVRRAFGQVSFPRPGPEQLHGFRYARQVGLHSALDAVGLTPPPLFHRPDVKPPDPDEDIDGAHITLGDERRVRSLDDTIGERVPIVPVHRFMNLVEVAAARLSCRRRHRSRRDRQPCSRLPRRRQAPRRGDTRRPRRRGPCHRPPAWRGRDRAETSAAPASPPHG